MSTPSTKELLYSDVEIALRDSVREMLAQRSSVAGILSRIESGEPFDAGLWRTLAVEMGLAGIAIPEEFGGSGASLREAAVVMEELGRGVAPVPYLSSAIVATTVLLACAASPAHASADAARGALQALASGGAIGVLAVPFSRAGGTGPATISVDVVDGRLTGTVVGVADGLAATLLLVPTTDGLYLVDAESVSRTGGVSLDLTRPLADLRFADVPGQHLASIVDSDVVVAAGLTVGAALLASEQLGMAEWCLYTTVEYLKVRHQFARPVGSFQALKHRLADLWAELTQVRAVARYAAVCAADSDPDLPVAASLAQAFCGPSAVHAAEECVQLHGGIGFTWEHPAHLYLKRAKADAIAFGTADRHRDRLSELVDLPA